MTRLALPFLLLALGLAACDSGEPDPPAPPYLGDFSATVTSSAGDSVAFSGNALTRFAGDTLQTITLAEVDEGDEGELDLRRSVMLSASTLFPSSPGVYDIGDAVSGDAPFTALYSDFTRLGAPFFFAESGTLTLEAVTETTVAGRFAFEGTGRSSNPDSISARYAARGTFEAVVVRPPDQR